MSVQTHIQISKDSKDNELNFSEKETYNYDFKSVCLKENVHLKREKNIDLYLLQFYLENKNRNLCDIINLNMYS